MSVTTLQESSISFVCVLTQVCAICFAFKIRSCWIAQACLELGIPPTLSPPRARITVGSHHTWFVELNKF